MRLTRSEKKGLFCLAVEIMDAERGGRAQPVGAERVQTSAQGGGRVLHDYAIDLLSCLPECPCERHSVACAYLDGQEESEGRPLRHNEKAALRRFWGRARAKRGLIPTGLRILERLDS